MKVVAPVLPQMYSHLSFTKNVLTSSPVDMISSYPDNIGLKWCMLISCVVIDMLFNRMGRAANYRRAQGLHFERWKI